MSELPKRLQPHEIERLHRTFELIERAEREMKMRQEYMSLLLEKFGYQYGCSPRDINILTGDISRDEPAE